MCGEDFFVILRVLSRFIILFLCRTGGSQLHLSFLHQVTVCPALMFESDPFDRWATEFQCCQPGLRS